MNKNREILIKQKLLVYINKAQKSFQTTPKPQTKPNRAQKAQNNLKREKSTSQKKENKMIVNRLHE